MRKKADSCNAAVNLAQKKPTASIKAGGYRIIEKSQSSQNYNRSHVRDEQTREKNKADSKMGFDLIPAKIV
jgi:hypothetical protein